MSDRYPNDRYSAQVPSWKTMLREGACAHLEDMWERVLRSVLESGCQSGSDLLCGRMLGCLQNAVKVLDGPQYDDLKQSICDGVLSFQNQSAAERIKAFLHEFPSDPSLKKCVDLANMVAGGQGLSPDAFGTQTEFVFNVGLEFMLDEGVGWCESENADEKIWAVSVSSMLRAFACDGIDKKQWVDAVSAVAEIQRVVARLGSSVTGGSTVGARDCMRVITGSRRNVKTVMQTLKAHYDADCELHKTWPARFEDVLLPAVVGSAIRATEPFVLADVQLLTDNAAKAAAALNDVCRGGVAGKSWTHGKGESIVQHAGETFADKEDITREVERVAGLAKEAAFLLRGEFGADVYALFST